MAIAVHIANGNPANCDLLRYFPGSQRLNPTFRTEALILVNFYR